jgi:methylated-DNA-[protein]-cysteine S-methyltransferase
MMTNFSPKNDKGSFAYFENTAIGKITIEEMNGQILKVFFETDTFSIHAESKKTPILKEAFDQLAAYLSGNLRVFNLPLSTKGSQFQQNVWDAILKCQFGTVTSYKDIAKKIGAPRSVRAIGGATGKNPIPIFIPCHRVIGSCGSLTGYRGGLKLKEFLLRLEGISKI